MAEQVIFSHDILSQNYPCVAQCCIVSQLLFISSDFRLEDLNQGRSLPKTSTLAEEDSQEIPSTSRSYKFGTKKKFKHNKTTKGILNNP